MSNPGSKAYYAAMARDAEKEATRMKFDPQYSVYVSGPMRGVKDLNKPAFSAVARRAASRGWRVYNPSDESPEMAAATYATCIKKDVEFLLKAKGIVLLPGWQKSEGARFEAEVAKNFGLDFFEALPLRGNIDYTIRQTSVPEIGAEGIDQEARRLVYGDRAATYGHPRGDFDRVAKMWGAILNTDINAEQVAIMMVAFKLARLSQTPTHHDSQVDTIGYMLCLARLAEDPTEVAAWLAHEAEEAEAVADAQERVYGDAPNEAANLAAEQRSRMHARAEHADVDQSDPEAYAKFRGATETAWAGAGFHKPYIDHAVDGPRAADIKGEK